MVGDKEEIRHCERGQWQLLGDGCPSKSLSKPLKSVSGFMNLKNVSPLKISMKDYFQPVNHFHNWNETKEEVRGYVKLSREFDCISYVKRCKKHLHVLYLPLFCSFARSLQHFNVLGSGVRLGFLETNRISGSWLRFWAPNCVPGKRHGLKSNWVPDTKLDAGYFQVLSHIYKVVLIILKCENDNWRISIFEPKWYFFAIKWWKFMQKSMYKIAYIYMIWLKINWF